VWEAEERETAEELGTLTIRMKRLMELLGCDRISLGSSVCVPQ